MDREKNKICYPAFLKTIDFVPWVDFAPHHHAGWRIGNRLMRPAYGDRKLELRSLYRAASCPIRDRRKGSIHTRVLTPDSAAEQTSTNPHITLL